MTLDQAIDRYSNNAEYERRNGSLHGCMEFRQLTEWLKDYKRLLEQQQKSGKWKVTPMSKIAYCSICDKLIKDIPASIVTQFKFCPNCGARMESEK